MTARTERIVADLQALLRREAEVIRTAAFDHLERIEAEKTALTDRLMACDPAPDQSALIALQAQAARNGVLLEAAARGVATARRHLEELHAAARGFSSYDQSGREARIGAAPVGGADRRV